MYFTSLNIVTRPVGSRHVTRVQTTMTMTTTSTKKGGKDESQTVFWQLVRMLVWGRELAGRVGMQYSLPRLRSLAVRSLPSMLSLRSLAVHSLPSMLSVTSLPVSDRRVCLGTFCLCQLLEGPV